MAYEFIPNGELLYPHELERQPDADYVPLYTAPPKREWVGLTDDEMNELWVEYHGDSCIADGRIPEYEKAIEARLKDKNI